MSEDPRLSAEMADLAPAAVHPDGKRLSGAGGVRSMTPWPDPDDHLVEPGTRCEVFHGELVYVSPARPGHGDVHSLLDTVIGQHAAPGFRASSKLLTRRSLDNDFATDVSVRRAGRNPVTGHRYLEEIAFEIFFDESRAYTRVRARTVVEHGVRRMFGIFGQERWPGSDEDDVVDYTVAEWSAERDDWAVLYPGAVIEDPALLLPIPVEALIDELASDDAVVRALLAKENRVLKRALEERTIRQRLAATREIIFRILEYRQIVPDAAVRARIEACDDLETLERWLLRATEIHDAAELLG